jgi:DnaJ domain
VMILCKFCGKEIHFDERIKSRYGKFIPLSGEKGTAKHRCKARPFNRQTRRQWWRQQRRDQWQREQEKLSHVRKPRSLAKSLQELGLTPAFRFPPYTLEEIKRAYRQLALQYHPDKSGTPATAERFIAVQDAYEYCLKELTSSAK